MTRTGNLALSLAALALGACALPPAPFGGNAAPQPSASAGAILPTGGLPGTAGTGIRANVGDVTLALGAEQDFGPSIRSAEGVPVTTTLVWTSSNDKVATVGGQSGRIRAVGQGQAVITASLLNDPNVRAVIVVTVEEKPTVLLVKVEPSTTGMVVGDKIKMTGEVRMADGQVNGNVTWGSSDDTIATINGTTGELSALRAGRVTVVASYTADPRYKGLAEVEVVTERGKLPTIASPTPVVFKPGATPLPTATPTPSATTASGASPSPSPTASTASTPAAASKATLTGFVLNSETGKGEPDVTLSLPGGASVKSSPDGSYSIAVPLGSVTITATKARFDTKGNELKIVIGQADATVKAEPISLTPVHWSNQLSGVSKDLQDVFSVDDTHAWVAGDGGTLLRTTDGGENWQPAQSAPAADFTKLFFLDRNTGWVVGNGGRILKSVDGGNSWTAQAVPGNANSATIPNFTDIQFLDASIGWAITSEALYSTKDGGQNWKRDPSVNGRCLHFLDASRGVIGKHRSVLITTTGGDSWQEGATDMSTGFGFGILNIVMLSRSEVWAFGGFAFKSNDSGLTFSTVGEFGDNTTTGVFKDPSERVIERVNSVSYPGIHFSSPTVGWRVGESGKIQRY